MSQEDNCAKVKWLIQTWTYGENERELARQQIYGDPNLELFPMVVKYIGEIKNDREQRGTAYRFVGTMLLRSGKTDIAEFMIDQIVNEPKKKLRGQLLLEIARGVGKGASASNAENVLRHADDGEKMVTLRHAAFEALGACGGDPRAETRLLQILTELKESGWALYSAVRSLSYVATQAATPVMHHLLEHIDKLPIKQRKKEIKYLAIKILVEVGGEQERELCLRFLGDRDASTKRQAMREDAAVIRKRKMRTPILAYLEASH